ncbi:hypothetical protein [Escherichia coli]|uniref:hypothetical protein n=1 Tax=Escherichia coli TaxID=562 RepID=UPI001594B5C9|nr:hypothetical protein [Escherichia coli]
MANMPTPITHVITRTQVEKAVRALGLDPGEVTGLEITRDQVEFRTYPLNKEGLPIIRGASSSYYVSTINLPVVEDYHLDSDTKES